MLCIHSNPVGELGTRDTGGMSVYIRELARELSEFRFVSGCVHAVSESFRFIHNSAV